MHAQKQPGLNYIGVLCPLGRLLSDRLRGLADIADRFGSGTLRLTVWQNLLISDMPDDEAGCGTRSAIARLGLDWRASHLRGGLVACTGNAGCKFSASDTKRHAAALADYLEQHITIDQPVNIHLTGCHHSCAQHYVADIGLLATKVEQGDDMVEGYDLLVGGGAGAEQKLGRLVRDKVVFDDLPPIVLTHVPRLAGRSARHRTRPSRPITARPVGRRSPPLRRARCRRLAVMNAISPPIPLIPENAPFQPGAAGVAERLPRRSLRRRDRVRPLNRHAPPAAEPEDFPWHDPALELDERMTLAEGRPLQAAADGGDGAARLRPVRLSVPDLRRGAGRGARGHDLALRPRRQADRADW